MVRERVRDSIVPIPRNHFVIIFVLFEITLLVYTLSHQLSLVTTKPILEVECLHTYIYNK